MSLQFLSLPKFVLFHCPRGAIKHPHSKSFFAVNTTVKTVTNEVLRTLRYMNVKNIVGKVEKPSNLTLIKVVDFFYNIS